MDEKYEYVKQQEQRTRRRNRITRSTGLQDKRERDTEIGWLSEGARERERDEYNTILRQRSWQREQMYVTEGEQLSLRNEKSAGCSYHVWGKNSYGRTKGITIDGEA